MKCWSAVLSALWLALLPVSLQAAKDPVPEEDEEEEPGQELGATTRAKPAESKALAEVARGIYTQADVGVFDYLGVIRNPDLGTSLGQGIYLGPSLRIQAGLDLLSKRHMGLSVGLSFWQTINNGLGYISPSALTPAQGDTRSFLYELSIRPTLILGSSQRLNWYLRLGGGVAFLQQALSEVPPLTRPIYSSFENGLVPIPFGSVGMGFEYYTRLAHFSVVFAEGNLQYFPGLDLGLGINIIGFKYTF